MQDHGAVDVNKLPRLGANVLQFLAFSRFELQIRFKYRIPVSSLGIG